MKETLKFMTDWEIEHEIELLHRQQKTYKDKIDEVETEIIGLKEELRRRKLEEDNYPK